MEPTNTTGAASPPPNLSQPTSLRPPSVPTDHRHTGTCPKILTTLLKHRLGRRDVGGIYHNFGGLKFHILWHCYFINPKFLLKKKYLSQSVYGKRKLHGLLILFMPFCIEIIGFSDHGFCTYIHTSHFSSLHVLLCKC